MQSNAERVRQAFSHWERGSSAEFFEIVSPTVTWRVIGTTPISATYTDRATFVAATRRLMARLGEPILATIVAVHDVGDTVVLQWEGRSRGLTQEFEAFALTLMREMPVKKVAEILGVTDTRLWRLLQCHIAAARKEADFSNVTCVGVDEMSIRKGHRYISVFADLVQRRVLFAAAGKDAGEIGRAHV